VTGGTKLAWVRSAQNRLTRVPLGQARAAVRSSVLGVTGGSKLAGVWFPNHAGVWFPNHAWVRSAQNRLTRVPLGQARAAVRSSALGATGDSIQRAVTSNSTAPALSVYPGFLGSVSKLPS